MKYRIIFSTFLVGMCVLFACTETSTEATNEVVENVELSAKQVELLTKMKETSLLLTDLVKRPDVVKELKYAADFSLKHGRDEDVYFSELFRDNAPYKTMGKTKNNVHFGAFKEQFREQLSIRAKANGSSIDSNLEEYLIEHNLKLYWPYSENWDDDVAPTISYHPLDNEDENEGFRPIEGTSEYEVITMNDEYAMSNPSLLLVPCEEPIFQIEDQIDVECDGWGGGGGGGWNPPSPPEPTGENPSGGDPDTPPGEYDYNQVLLGAARLLNHYDGIYAGGSEIRWQLSDAIKLTASDVTPVTKVADGSKNFTRNDIRNGKWKGLYSEMDDDWSEYELAKELYIWEGDEGDVKVNVSLGVSVKINNTGFSFEADARADRSRDDLCRKFLNRAVFYAQNRTPHPRHGLMEGFRVRACGDLRWTFAEIGININN